MSTISSLLSPTSSPSPSPSILSHQRLRGLILLRPQLLRPINHAIKIRPLVCASSSAFDDGFNASEKSNPKISSKKSILSNLIHEIEPFDVSLIQKDVPPNSVDAMKRTISSMLGLLPSDQFQVLIEAFWEALSKLLVSSMMTGYTLWNAEHRLCLERSLDTHDGNFEKQRPENAELDANGMFANSKISSKIRWKNKSISIHENFEEDPSHNIMGIQGLGEMTPDTKKYVLHLQSRLSSVKKELCEIKRKNAALQMQQFVGEEKNDLLDYLRSLQPEKVAELSEPTSPELQEIIHSIVHGLLATLSPKIHSMASPPSENASIEAMNVVNEEDYSEFGDNTSLHFQPFISLTRDYLARLLFWCMLLGHYLRGLEYRLELMELLTLSDGEESS